MVFIMDNKILSFGRSAGELHTWGELHTREKKSPQSCDGGRVTN